MASYGDPISSVETVQIISSTQVIDVVRIGFRTAPSGIVFYANAPNQNLVGIKSSDVAAIADAFLAPIAQGIEEAMGLGFVSSMVHEEDVAPSGLLTDYLVCTVAYSPPDSTLGPFEQAIRIPVYAFAADDPFFGPLVRDPLNAAYQALVTLAGV